MKNKLKKYTLILYFLLFFAADKLILIPEVKYKLTETLPGTPYIETLDNLPVEFFKTEDYKNKKKVWLFGSSRSLWFYKLPVEENTKRDPYLDAGAKQALSNYNIVPFATPGSTPSIYYVRLYQLLESGYRPDLIALEISIYAFNRQNRFVNSSKIEGIPLMFTLKHSNELPSEYVSDIITSRIFATTRYKVTVTAIKKNLLGLRKSAQNPLMENLFKSSADPFQELFEKMTGEERVNRVYTDLDYNDFKGDAVFTDPREKLMKIQLPLPILKKEFFTNYEYNEDMILFLELISRKARSENIPVVFWIQKEHPEMQKIIGEDNMDQKWFNRIKNISNQYEIPIMNFNDKGVLKCDHYGDVFHASGRCITEMSWNLISVLENKK